MAKSHKISNKKEKELLSSPGCVRDEELSQELAACGVEIYRLQDGAFLVKFDLWTDLYQASEQDVIDRLREAARTETGAVGRHVLDGRLPSGRRFPELLPQLIEQLAARTAIPLADLDFSDNSLRKLDKSLWLLGREKVYHADIFEPLLAYLYALARKRCIAASNRFPSIEMRLDHGVLAPWLVVSPISAQFFSVVVDQINEWKSSRLLRTLLPLHIGWFLTSVETAKLE